jgi:hypothetical protein
MCLHSTQEMQLAELKSAVESTVKQPRSHQDWPMVRQKLLWLRDWQTEQPESAWDEPSPYHGLFWRIPRETVETEVLKALLAAKGKLSNIQGFLSILTDIIFRVSTGR